MNHFPFSSRAAFVALALAIVALVSLLTLNMPTGGNMPVDRVETSSAPSTASSTMPNGDSAWAQVEGPMMVTVGDIACPPGKQVTATTCQQLATAKQARTYNPRKVVVLGDTQYNAGTLREYRNSYAKSWGGLKAITKPVIGNHEYNTRGGAGYFAYFKGQTGTHGYYAFNVGSWRIYALNSNCEQISCSAEARWLSKDMSAHPRLCSAIAMHHPLYSSGFEHGDSPEGRRFWRIGQRYGVDLALAGHDHNYERFAPMDADGNQVPGGITSFVVGTGGKDLYTSRRIREGSEVFSNERAGVLALKLGEGEFGYNFTSVAGSNVDSGIKGCE